jgi:hypothetical protein
MINRRSFLGSAMGLGLGLSNFGQGINPLFGKELKETNRRWENLTDLEAIFHKNLAVMREAARTYIRRASRQASKGTSLTGSYYWVPVPKLREQFRPNAEYECKQEGIEWIVQEFFDCWTPSTDHPYVWKHVLDSLIFRWKHPIVGVEYGGLPRGRVCRVDPLSATGGKRHSYVIFEGQDCPLGPPGISAVKSLFNLDAATPAVISEQYRLASGQPEALARALEWDRGSRELKEWSSGN